MYLLTLPKVVVEEVVRIPQGRPAIRGVTGWGRQEQDHPDREEEGDGGTVRRMLKAQCWWIRSKDRMPGNRRTKARSRGTELAPVGPEGSTSTRSAAGWVRSRKEGVLIGNGLALGETLCHEIQFTKCIGRRTRFKGNGCLLTSWLLIQFLTYLLGVVRKDCT